MTEIIPSDSRYVPFTQQPSCCVPTCLQMVMYRRGIPLMPAEELGYHLGLTVSTDDKQLFYNPRASEERPPAGYGTRVYDSEFEPNKVFSSLGLPLQYKLASIDKFESSKAILAYLAAVEGTDRDVLLCFNHGALIDDPARDWGHVCVFDRVVDGAIRIIDPSPGHPKWRLVSADKLFEAMQKHRTAIKSAAGFWELIVNPGNGNLVGNTS